MTSEGFDQKRSQDLADNIDEDLELLKDYEDELRYEREPRIIGKYRRDIKRQQQAIATYKQEYADLQNLLKGSSSFAQSDIYSQKCRMNAPAKFHFNKKKTPEISAGMKYEPQLRLCVSTRKH